MRVIDAPWLPSLAGRAAELAGISLGDLPLEGRIDYAGEAGTHPHVSFLDVHHGGVPAARFKDKIVVIGDARLAEHDVRRHVPVGTSITPMSGGEILANEIATALDEFPLRDGPVWVTVLLIVSLAAVPAALAIRYRTGAAVSLSLTAGLAFLVGAQAAYAAGWILPVITPLLALVLSVVASQVVARIWPGAPAPS